MIDLYDEESLLKRIRLQTSKAHDFEKEIPWDQALDLSKPLAPLDEKALAFPGASKEQRLVISQLMGLLINTCVYEMEDCLLRLREENWDKIRRKHPVSPEFRTLGELFFEEEDRHSKAFRRYVNKWCGAAGIDTNDLTQIMPRVQGTWSEKALRASLVTGAQSFWWIVAIVEQQFVALHEAINPHQKTVEPIYHQLHKLHFEEEVRHMPFPYLVIELVKGRSAPLMRPLHWEELRGAQALQTIWTLSSLGHLLKEIKRRRKENPHFEVLASCLPLLENQPKHRLLWELLTKTPYVSTLVNPNAHKKIKKFAEKLEVGEMPFPDLSEKDLVNY